MRKAFTLIELLVVISIIALLIALLLPALGAARRSGIRTQCLSQVRSIGQASAAYAADNKGAYPQREADSSAGIAYPHQTYTGTVGGAFDLNTNFFSQYLPITLSTTSNDRQGDEILFCPGDLYDVRNPNNGDWRYFYTHITYQYMRIGQGTSRWLYTEKGAVKQPDLTGRDSIEPSNYPLWGDMTVDLMNGIYLGHDAASTPAPPEGMNTAYGDGSARWTNWSECDPYYRGSGNYEWYWSEASD